VALIIPAAIVFFIDLQVREEGMVVMVVILVPALKDGGRQYVFLKIFIYECKITYGGGSSSMRRRKVVGHGIDVAIYCPPPPPPPPPLPLGVVYDLVEYFLMGIRCLPPCRQ